MKLLNLDKFQRNVPREATEVRVWKLVLNVFRTLLVQQGLLTVQLVIRELLLTRQKQDVVSDLLSKEVKLRIF